MERKNQRTFPRKKFALIPNFSESLYSMKKNRINEMERASPNVYMDIPSSSILGYIIIYLKINFVPVPGKSAGT